MENKQEKFMQEFAPIKENLWKFCLHIANSREDAKDLLQETIEISYIQFDKIQNYSTMLSYMFTIASRKNMQYRNKSKVLDKITPELENNIDLNYVSPEVQFDIKVLYKALRQLPKEQEEAIILQEIIGFSQNEICKIQNISLFTLKKRLYRTKLKLKKMLNESSKDNIKIVDKSFENEIEGQSLKYYETLQVSNNGGNYEN